MIDPYTCSKHNKTIVADGSSEEVKNIFSQADKKEKKKGRESSTGIYMLG